MLAAPANLLTRWTAEQHAFDHVDQFALAPLNHRRLEQVYVPQPPDHRRAREVANRDRVETPF